MCAIHNCSLLEIRSRPSTTTGLSFYVQWVVAQLRAHQRAWSLYIWRLPWNIHRNYSEGREILYILTSIYFAHSTPLPHWPWLYTSAVTGIRRVCPVDHTMWVSDYQNISESSSSTMIAVSDHSMENWVPFESGMRWSCDPERGVRSGWPLCLLRVRYVDPSRLSQVQAKQCETRFRCQGQDNLSCCRTFCLFRMVASRPGYTHWEYSRISIFCCTSYLGS